MLAEGRKTKLYLADRRKIGGNIMADNTNVTENGTNNTQGSSGNNPALFTQADVDGIVSGRVNAEKAKYNDLQTKYDGVVKELNTYKTQLEGIKRDSALAEAGIQKQYRDYISFEANKLVNDKTTFEEAVNTVIKANSQLLGIKSDEQSGGSKGTEKKTEKETESKDSTETVKIINVKTQGGSASSQSNADAVQAYLKSRGLA